MIVVLEPGVQSTLQAAPRSGLRRAGVPASGPADPLSMALANRLVGNPLDAVTIEITFGPAAFRFEAPVQVAVTGATSSVSINDQPAGPHVTIDVPAGAQLRMSAATAGARLYLAVSGRLAASDVLGSRSTYLPAGLGGHEGRALKRSDRIGLEAGGPAPRLATPGDLILPPSSAYALRAVAGPDLTGSPDVFRDTAFQVSARISRMGAELAGAFPVPANSALRPSSAVFPGALQATPEGRGFLLLPDGQTTGGYPHLLQVIRADRHLLGQIRPGDTVRFLPRTQAQAEEALHAKQALLERWLPTFRL